MISHPPGKEKARDRLHRIQTTFQQTSQGKWPDLIQRTIACPTLQYEQDDNQPLVASHDSLPAKTAKRLYKTASQGQNGKTWRQLKASPPALVGPDQWNEAITKISPRERQEGPLSERTSSLKLGARLPRSLTRIAKLKKHKAADAGGWTTESAQSCLDHPRLKIALLAWIHGQAVSPLVPARRVGLAHAHRRVCLDKGGGAIRPILIGMSWSKLLSPLVLRNAKSNLDVFLRDRQFGIGTLQGGLAMTTALRATLAEHPSHVVACLDFKNAFGAIERTTCMEILRELRPQSPAWLDTVNIMMSQPALVTNPCRNHAAITYDGLHKRIKQLTSEVRTLSVLVGPADDIATVLQKLPRAFLPTGLSLQPQKKKPALGPTSQADRESSGLTAHAGTSEGIPGSHHSGGRPHRPISEMLRQQWPTTSERLLCFRTS